MRSQAHSLRSPSPCSDGTRARSVIAALLMGLASQMLACGSGQPKIVAGPMPEGGSFTGVYFSPQYGQMDMVQNGSAVIGEYKQDERTGKIQGEVSGDLMRFEWVEHKAMVANRSNEARGHGYFRYQVDKANGDHVLTGEWGLGDSETGGGPWRAVKSKRKVPHLSTESGESSSGGESNSSDESNSNSGSNENSSDDLF